MKSRIKKPALSLAALAMAVGLALPAAIMAQESPPPQPKVTKTTKAQKTAKARKTSVKKSARTMQIQQALQKAGFNPGPIDGKMGKKTRTAIKAFQKKNGLKATGRLNKATSAKLKEATM